MSIRIDGTNTTANPGITGGDADTGLQFGTDEVKIVTGGTDRVTVDSSGRLLVGTSSSSQNARAVFQGNSGGSGGFAGLVKVSFDTTSPGSTADIGRIAFTDSGQVEAATISGRRDSGTWTSGSSQPTALVFNTTANVASSPTERMRLTSNGSLCLANTTRQLEGTFCPDGIIGTQPAISCYQNATNSQEQISFRNPNGVVGSINTNGSSTSYATSSDYRLKENVVPLTGASSRLNQLQVHRFNFITDPSETVDGFIAHEAQTVVPECVTGEKDAVDNEGNPVYQGIDQSKLVPLLTAVAGSNRQD